MIALVGSAFYIFVCTNMYNIIKTYATASFIYCTYSYSTTVLVNFEADLLC